MTKDWIVPIGLPILTVLASVVGAVTSVITNVNTRKLDDLQDRVEKEQAKIASLRKELLSVYKNVSELLEIEKELMTELDIGKRTSRLGHITDRHIQPKHVENRIRELEQDLKLN